MSVIDGFVRRDANGYPLEGGIVLSKAATLDASNTTASEKLFKVTGSVLVKRLYGIVEVALSSAITAAHWRTDDQTAQVAISLATGTTLSSFAIGSLIVRKSVVAVALTGDNASAAKVTDPVAATAPDVFMPFVVTQKTGAVLTEIEFRYTTTNTPATGRIGFYIEYIPLTPDSRVDLV